MRYMKLPELRILTISEFNLEQSRQGDKELDLIRESDKARKGEMAVSGLNFRS
jgi:hypothetical protein